MFIERGGNGLTFFGHLGFSGGLLSYLGTLVSATMGTRDEWGIAWLAIPVAGPWIAIEQGQYESPESLAVAVTMGLLQAMSGLVIFVSELIVQFDREERLPPEVDLGLGPTPGGVFVNLTWRPESGG